MPLGLTSASGRAKLPPNTSATPSNYTHPSLVYSPLAGAPAVPVVLAWREGQGHPAIPDLLALARGPRGRRSLS
ncbi:hypothetical protein GCM10010404_01150 [Nonomuraea africana]|uniref:LysR substrate-binding domain-containing protein n=1 Tax=Nonomuraea africana TaxID=46171 RepID=A0ABR9KBX1_9ACTN|nr:hypothetical protein [Nonomuraea africana]MBE1559506.1 hypothetical protein [Nonomuraea africana]